jgi:hypothetical protein
MPKDHYIADNGLLVYYVDDEHRRSHLQAMRQERLLEQGKIERWFKVMDKKVREEPDEWNLRERGQMHLYFGQTHEARADFEQMWQFQSRGPWEGNGKLHDNLTADFIGVTYWYECHRDLAMAFWRYTVQSLMANRVSNAQGGGGIESGLLLWFGTAYHGGAADVELVRQFFLERLASRHWSHNLVRWPGPLVRFFLNEIDEAALLQSAEKAEPESGRHQYLCEAHFVLAIRAREANRHTAARKHMKLAAEDKGPTSVSDYFNLHMWYLARSILKM